MPSFCCLNNVDKLLSGFRIQSEWMCPRADQFHLHESRTETHRWLEREDAFPRWRFQALDGTCVSVWQHCFVLKNSCFCLLFTVPIQRCLSRFLHHVLCHTYIRGFIFFQQFGLLYRAWHHLLLSEHFWSDAPIIIFFVDFNAWLNSCSVLA